MPKRIIGNHLKCRRCQSPDAIIQLMNNRYVVYCLHCASQGFGEYLLKEQGRSKNPQSAKEILAKHNLRVMD